MTKECFSDIFEMPGEITWRLDENANGESIVDGINILARAVGPSFLVNGISDNKRYYPKKLWENAIKKNEEKINQGQMLGTIGHNQSLDDNAILEGKASHRISKMWIDEKHGVGMSEILVLNTPAGRNLNALLRGGVKFPVSSRGYGEYSGKHGGVPMVNPDTFELETFDFVRNPGVKSAVPELVEQKKENNTNNDEIEQNILDENELEESVMSNTNTKVLETLTAEKLKLQDELNSVISENKKLNDQVLSLTANVRNLEKLGNVQEEKISRNKDYAIDLNEYKRLGSVNDIRYKLDNAKRLEERIQSLGSIDGLSAKIATYESLGSVDQIKSLVRDLESYKTFGSCKEISKVIDMTEAYMNFGSPEDIRAKLDVANMYEKFGSVQDIEDLLSMTESYANLGSPSEISEVFQMAEAYANLGTPDEVEDILRITEEYSNIGSPDDINEVLDIVESYAQLGTPEEVDHLCDITETYSNLGTPNELNSILDFTEIYTELGSVNEVNTLISVTEEYAELGSPDDISAVFDIVESYSELGTPDEIKEVFDVTKTYTEFGTPEEVEEVFGEVESMMHQMEEEKRKVESEALSESLDVAPTVADALLSNMDKDQARELVESIRKRKEISERYRIQVSEEEETSESFERIDESIQDSSLPRGSRLMKQMSK